MFLKNLDMVRGATILIILTVFNQTLTGSVFDQFTTPDKKDKNKMLMYLRGMFKPDVATTVKVTPVTPAIDALSVKQVWEGTGLPDRSDKSKMLAYLRGMNAATKISGAAYDESRHRVVEKKSDIHKQNIKNPVVDTFKGSDHEVSWGNANPATLPTILQLEPEVIKDNPFKAIFDRGNNQKYKNRYDDFILNILDKESESADKSASKNLTESKYEIVLPENKSPFIFAPPTKRPKKKESNKLSDSCKSELLSLKKQKLQLEIGKLMRQNYKLDLELLKLEKALGIKRPSKFTLQLYLQDKKSSLTANAGETDDAD